MTPLQQALERLQQHVESLPPTVRDALDVVLGATCGTCRHYRPETQGVYGTCQVNSDAVWIETEAHTEKSHGCMAWEKREETA